MFNPKEEEVTFELPAQCNDGVWRLVVDTSQDTLPREAASEAVKDTVKLIPHSLAVLVRE